MADPCIYHWSRTCIFCFVPHKCWWLACSLPLGTWWNCLDSSRSWMALTNCTRELLDNIRCVLDSSAKLKFCRQFSYAMQIDRECWYPLFTIKKERVQFEFQDPRVDSEGQCWNLSRMAPGVLDGTSIHTIVLTSIFVSGTPVTSFRHYTYTRVHCPDLFKFQVQTIFQWLVQPTKIISVAMDRQNEMSFWVGEFSKAQIRTPSHRTKYVSCARAVEAPMELMCVWGSTRTQQALYNTLHVGVWNSTRSILVSMLVSLAGKQRQPSALHFAGSSEASCSEHRRHRTKSTKRRM